MKIRLVYSFFLWVSAHNLFGQGFLDPFFGVGGKVQTFISPMSGAAGLAMNQQSDGRIVMVGAAGTVMGGGDFAVARYLPNGILDNTFGLDGIVTTDFGTNDDIAKSLAILPDGKIIVAGYARFDFPVGQKFAVARYNPDGSLDNSFSDDGKLTFNAGTSTTGDNIFAEPCGIALQDDGKFVIAGTTGDNGNDFVLARFTNSGSFDGSFGDLNNGRVYTNFSYVNYPSTDQAKSIAIQPDGKILLGGYTYEQGQNISFDFAIARYTTGGTLDPSFGQFGKTVVDLGNSGDLINGLCVLPNGNIVAVGTTTTNNQATSYNVAVAMFTQNGSLDTNFGSDGTLDVDIYTNSEDIGYGVIALDSNRIAIAGSTKKNSTAIDISVDFFLLSVNMSGTIDPFFGNNGKIVTDFYNGDDIPFSIVLQADQKILIGGSSDSTNSSRSGFGMARYLPVPISAANDVNNLNHFRIYPNPTNSWIYIDLMDNFGPNEFKIRNLLGELILYNQIVSGYEAIDVSKLPQGLYIIEIKGEGGITARQFIKI